MCRCCLQIHGKSRFPGLSVWLADGTRCPVSIPQGCLLCQVCVCEWFDKMCVCVWQQHVATCGCLLQVVGAGLVLQGFWIDAQVPKCCNWSGDCCCWLLQAGKQLEWLTGGRVKAGMHEVRRGSRSRMGAGLYKSADL